MFEHHARGAKTDSRPGQVNERVSGCPPRNGGNPTRPWNGSASTSPTLPGCGLRSISADYFAIYHKMQESCLARKPAVQPGSMWPASWPEEWFARRLEFSRISAGSPAAPRPFEKVTLPQLTYFCNAHVRYRLLFAIVPLLFCLVKPSAAISGAWVGAVCANLGKSWPDQVGRQLNGQPRQGICQSSRSKKPAPAGFASSHPGRR